MVLMSLLLYRRAGSDVTTVSCHVIRSCCFPLHDIVVVQCFIVSCDTMVLRWCYIPCAISSFTCPIASLYRTVSCHVIRPCCFPLHDIVLIWCFIVSCDTMVLRWCSSPLCYIVVYLSHSFPIVVESPM